MTPEQRAHNDARMQNEHIEFLRNAPTAGTGSGIDDLESNLRNELRLLKEEYFLRSMPIVNQLMDISNLRSMPSMVIYDSNIDPTILAEIRQNAGME